MFFNQAKKNKGVSALTSTSPAALGNLQFLDNVKG